MRTLELRERTRKRLPSYDSGLQFNSFARRVQRSSANLFEFAFACVRGDYQRINDTAVEELGSLYVSDFFQTPVPVSRLIKYFLLCSTTQLTQSLVALH